MSLSESSHKSRFEATATCTGLGDFSTSTPSPAINVGSKGETGADDPSPVRLAKNDLKKQLCKTIKITM